MDNEKMQNGDLTPEETPVPEEPSVPAEPAEETVREPAAEPAEETGENAQAWFEMEPADDGEEPPLPPVKKKGWIGWVILAVVLAAAAVALTMGLSKPAETGEETEDIRIAGSEKAYTVAAEDVTEEVSARLVAENLPKDLGSQITRLFGGSAAPEARMTNGDLAVYYWNGFYQFNNQYYYYLSMMGMDPANLEGSEFEEGQTWQEYFLSRSLMAFRAQSSVYQQAMAEGFTLPEDLQTQYDQMVEDVSSMEDIESQLQAVYGPGVTLDDYFRYMKASYIYTAYLDKLREGISFTDEELSAFYDENAERYEAQGVEKDDRHMVNVRHILIQPEDAEDETTWTAAEELAQSIYERWQREGATEERFAELADMETEDPGSQGTGGLYEDVYPGQMAEAFNDWCFDESRQPGDSGIVRTDYGYHIMYFVGQAEGVHWKQVAEEELGTVRVDEMIQDITAKYDFHYDTEAIAIALPDQIAEGQDAD